MDESFFASEQTFGTPELQMPEHLQEPVRRHLEELHERYRQMNWARRVGFGKRPALVVIDLALFWTKPETQMGTHLDSVVEATCRILAGARAAKVPIFFSTSDFDPDELPDFNSKKSVMEADASLFELDPKLQRRPNEKLLRKRYSSCFKGTNLLQMLAALGTDTLLVTGVSTSHCVYATCRDACESFRVIVAREGVGERCQIMHMVNLLDIDIDIGDVVPADDVIAYLGALSSV